MVAYVLMSGALPFDATSTEGIKRSIMCKWRCFCRCFLLVVVVVVETVVLCCRCGVFALHLFSAMTFLVRL